MSTLVRPSRVLSALLVALACVAFVVGGHVASPTSQGAHGAAGPNRASGPVSTPGAPAARTRATGVVRHEATRPSAHRAAVDHTSATPLPAVVATATTISFSSPVRAGRTTLPDQSRLDGRTPGATRGRAPPR